MPLPVHNTWQTCDEYFTLRPDGVSLRRRYFTIRVSLNTVTYESCPMDISVCLNVMKHDDETPVRYSWKHGPVGLAKMRFL
jgi:hypothetical protein